jgi:hypothetical protein
MLIPKGSRDHIPAPNRKSPVPAADIRCQSEHRWAIDFAHGLLWKKTTEPRHVLHKAEFRPWSEVVVFDGAQLTRLTPRNWNQHWEEGDITADVTTSKRGYLQDVRHVHDMPLFFAHGVIGDHRGKDLAHGIPGIEYDDIDMTVSSVVVDDESKTPRLATLRTAGRYPFKDGITEYVVDMGRDSAIVTKSLYAEGRLSHRMEIAHQKYGEQWWLPTQWRVTVLNEDQQLQYSMQVKVIDAVVNEEIDDSVFRPEIRPEYIVKRVAH